MLEILNAIASLATIATLAIQVGVPLRSDGSPDFEAVLASLNLTSEQESTISLPGATEIIGLLIIDNDLLDEITKTLEACIQKYKTAIKTASSQRENEVVDKKAERCVCDALNRIKRRNDGDLPPGQFKKWWLSYRCVDDYDY